MPESEEPKKTTKKKPPSTADILKKIRQKKGLSSTPPVQPKRTPKKSPGSKPKTVQTKSTTPKQTKPVIKKASSASKPLLKSSKKTEPPQIETPVSDVEHNDKPAFLDDVDSPETINIEKSESGIPPRKKHKKFISAKVIPQSSYQRMKDLIFKRWFLQLIALFWMTCIVGYAIVLVLTQFSYRETILENVDRGWIALEEGNNTEAQRIFQETLAFYKTYRIGFSKHLWFNDGQTEVAVLNMAQGWRNLGDMEKGIESLKQVCLHDPFTTNTWMDGMMRNQIITFIDRQQWDDDELVKMYWYLMERDPKDWDVGEIYLPLMTEWVAMQLYPIGERFAKAYDVVYGMPIQMNESGNSFTINAETYYKQDQGDETLTIILPIRITQDSKTRFTWYLKQGVKCVFFCKEIDGSYVLDGIEGIHMNDTYFMEEFNDTVQTYSYQ